MTRKKVDTPGQVKFPSLLLQLEGESIVATWDWPDKKMTDEDIHSLGFVFYILNTGRLHEMIADALIKRAQEGDEAYISEAIFRAANHYFEKDRQETPEDAEDDPGDLDDPIVCPSRAFDGPRREGEA